MALLGYEYGPSRFNPVDFDADSWVRIAKAAGMRWVRVSTRLPVRPCMHPSIRLAVRGLVLMPVSIMGRL